MANPEIEREIDNFANKTLHFKSNVRLSSVRQVCSKDIQYYDRLWNQKLKELETDDTLYLNSPCPD